MAFRNFLPGQNHRFSFCLFPFIFYLPFSSPSLSPSILVAALTSVLLSALVSIPFYTLPVHILFFIFLSIISAEKEGVRFHRVNTERSFHGILIKTTGFLTLTVIALFLIKHAKQQYKDYFVFDEGVMLYNTTNYNEAGKVFSELTESLKYNGIYWQYYAKAINMNGDYTESVELYERAKRFTSDEYLYTSLGDSYKAINEFGKAEEAYIHASFLSPHKLYPLYLLARMYDETGEKEKACRTAREILNKKVKVESKAVEEILEEMRRILEKHDRPISWEQSDPGNNINK